jgi:exodeoxyribonuclease V alpha subunit
MTTTSTGLLTTLNHWSDQGILRRLDSAMAHFAHQRDPQASPLLLLGCALLTHMEGRGHSCLPLAPLLQHPQSLLAWPAAAQLQLETLWNDLPPALPVWVSALRQSPLVRTLCPHQPDLGQPLVLGGTDEAPLLYLRRYWLYEAQVVAAIMDCTHNSLPVDMARARAWLDRLFDRKPAHIDIDWQKAACALALRNRLTIITGGPGTGKTYTAARLLALLLAMHPAPDSLKVALAAPTGKAAARLRQSIDQSLLDLQGRMGQDLDLLALAQRIGQAKTVHALLGARPDTRQFRYTAAQPLDLDILIVDETSMVHLEMMSALLQALPPHARLVLLGDKDQLASVEAGAVLGDLCARAEQPQYRQSTRDYVLACCGETLPESAGNQSDSDSDSGTPLAQQTVMLRHSVRFGSTIGSFAQAINRGDAQRAQALLQEDTSQVIWQAPPALASPDTVLQLALQGRPGASPSYADYLQLILHRPPVQDGDTTAHLHWVREVLQAFDQFRILCAVHAGPWGDQEINRGVQRTLAHAGLLQPNGEWFTGRPIMVTRNDPALGVFNGDIGVVLPAAADTSRLRAYFLDGDQIRSVSVGRLAHAETAFAMTVHKSQGSEFRHTVLVLPADSGDIITRELVYTGITRARTYFSLVQGSPGVLTQASQRRILRASGLQTRNL